MTTTLASSEVATATATGARGSATPTGGAERRGGVSCGGVLLAAVGAVLGVFW